MNERRTSSDSPTRIRRPAMRRDGVRATHYGDFAIVSTDDAAAQGILCDKLDGHGYRPVVVDSPARIDEMAARIQPVVILLDLDRADGQGLAALSRIRKRSAVPVIALSARAAEGDKVSALDAGADDYVTKPLGMKELLARIRVVLRHARARPVDGEPFAVGPIRIDTARYRVTVADKPVHLTPTEFQLLSLLARRRGAVVTREQVLQEIWGGADHAEQLRVHISALRKKLEQDPGHPRLLVTVLGVGYRLEAQPRVLIHVARLLMRTLAGTGTEDRMAAAVLAICEAARCVGIDVVEDRATPLTIVFKDPRQVALGR